MFIQRDTFKLDEMEEIELEGNYEIKTVKNRNEEAYKLGGYINCQASYVIGNVLVRSDTEGIYDLIDVFIRYSYSPCEDLNLSFINTTEQMIFGGTICPTKKILFKYKGKIFVAYGRYIYGFYKDHVEIIPQNNTANQTIILQNPEHEYFKNDEYVYSFGIYDEDTKVTDAFGLYR